MKKFLLLCFILFSIPMVVLAQSSSVTITIIENFIQPESAQFVISLSGARSINIEFGETTALGGKIFLNEIKTGHTFNYLSLKPDTEYYFRVIIKDNGEEVQTGDLYKFRSAPELSFHSVDLRQNGATIQVSFSTSTNCKAGISYFENNIGIPLEKQSTVMSKSHTLVLEGLSTKNTYFYQISCTTDSGAVAYENDLMQEFRLTEFEPEETQEIEQIVEQEMEPIKQQQIETKTDIDSIKQEVIDREQARQTTIDQGLSENLKGRILLQVEERGEAWYIEPETKKRHYLANGDSAFSLMRSVGIGISNADLEKIPVDISIDTDPTDSDTDGISDNLEIALGTNPLTNDSDSDGFADSIEIENGFNPIGEGKMNVDVEFAKRLSGKIVLQVERNGEAWYINPENNKRYYLGRGADAYELMRTLGLGATNENISKIDIAL